MDILSIEIPPNRLPERKYIIEVIFNNFLGLDYRVVIEERKDIKIYKNDSVLVLADTFFKLPENYWLKKESLPSVPLKIWDVSRTIYDGNLISKKLPVIYGDNPDSNEFLKINAKRSYLGLDILGSAFFMLTSYEECIIQHRDQHDRFPADASLAFQQNFLNRPIINEYLEILWFCLSLLWPDLRRKERQFKISPSHDVDAPGENYFKSHYELARACAGDLIKRKQPLGAIQRILNWNYLKSAGFGKDKYNTFDLIMNINEENNLNSSFFFIAGRSGGAIDGDYSIEQPEILKLMRKIHSRSHEIGLHASYNSYKNVEQIKKEFKKLLKVCDQEGIKQDIWGGRQHFLRWKCPETFQNWESAGLSYDTTLSFAKRAGFRCGICYEYSVFNLYNRTPLKLKERPLIVMECSVLDLYSKYEDAYDVINLLKENCRNFKGNFTLLWHNHRFVNPEELYLYKSIVKK